MMLDELQRRNYSPSTIRCYIHAVEDFSKYFHRSPERLGPSHIRAYPVHLFRDRKLSPGTIQSRSAALRFLFVKTLRRPYLLDEIPFPKRPRKLPTVLSPEEVARLIDSARNLMHRTMLMTLYATGLRRAELCHLKVADIDSERMVIHVHQGNGGIGCDAKQYVARSHGRGAGTYFRGKQHRLAPDNAGFIRLQLHTGYLGRDGIEVCTIVPGDFGVDEPQIGFMHNFGSSQGMPLAFCR
jgi:integrase